MNQFLIFYAPFIVLTVGLVVAFVVAPMDAVLQDEEKEK